MKRIFACRRSSLALIAMLLLSGIALKNGADVASAIAMICMGVAGANAYEAKK